MTDERAIEILDPEHHEHYESIEPVNEACRIGMGAIRKVKELRSENAALRERLGKWAVDNEIVMEPRVKDGQTYYVISRKERRIVTHYICT